MIWKLIDDLSNIINNILSDRAIIIELYKITLEELRHQERIYNQLVTSVFIIIPIFLTAVTFLLSRDALINLVYINYLKWSIFLLLVILFIIFWLLMLRLNRRFRVCKEVINKLEDKLIHSANNTTLNNLLIIGELEKKSFDVIFGKYRFILYIGGSLIAIILIWFALFQWV